MPSINCKIKLNLTWEKECVLSTDADDVANPGIMMQYLLLMIQNCCQKKIIKILLNNKIKDIKDLFIGTNIKQKNKMKMRPIMFLNILI